MKEIVNDGFAKVVKPYMDAQDKKSREIIAPVEVSPAEAPHSVGDQIIYNGLLYDVTAPIEVEDSLETSGAGANISAADNIEAQIKATKSQIQAAAAQAAAQNKNTQKMLAPVEEDETDASRAYVIGEQLILDGILYNVIDPIAQHGIITAEGAGANIEEADDVTTQLKADASALTALSGQVNDLTPNVIAQMNLLGAKNILQNTGSSRTRGTHTFTVNNDGSITINSSGPDSGNQAFVINNDFYIGEGVMASYDSRLIELNGYTISSGNSGDSSSTYGLYYNGTNRSVVLYIFAGYVANNLIIKPMIHPVDTDPEYVPFAMTNQEMTPYVQAVSNRNLLDNPWFTVNQRGQSNYTGLGYTVDRWASEYFNTSDITVNSDGISWSVQSDLNQRVPMLSELLGKVVTISALINDVVYSKTVTLENTTSRDWQVGSLFGPDSVTIDIYYTTAFASNNFLEFRIRKDAGITYPIKAVKLELGSVSTLAMDTAPNYTEELLKCQRYYQEVGKHWCLKGVAANNGFLYGQFRVPMRTAPTYKQIATVASFSSESQGDNVSNVTLEELSGSGMFYDKDGIGFFRVIKVQGTGTGDFVNGVIYVISNNILSFSADL